MSTANPPATTAKDWTPTIHLKPSSNLPTFPMKESHSILGNEKVSFSLPYPVTDANFNTVFHLSPLLSKHPCRYAVSWIREQI